MARNMNSRDGYLYRGVVEVTREPNPEGRYAWERSGGTSATHFGPYRDQGQAKAQCTRFISQLGRRSDDKTNFTVHRYIERSALTWERRQPETWVAPS